MKHFAIPAVLATVISLATDCRHVHAGMYNWQAVNPDSSVDNVPDPVALLKAVADARNEWGSNTLSLDVNYQSPSVTSRHRLEVVSDGSRRKFKVSGPNEVTHGTFDGDRFLYFDGISSVTIRDDHMPAPDYLFDPRTLGITASYRWGNTIAGCLGYQGAKRTEVVGQEDIEGKLVWHIRLRDQYDQELHFWIADTKHFPVYRYEYNSAGLRKVTTSSYAGPAGPGPIPSNVETRHFVKNEEDGSWHEIGKRTISVLTADVMTDIDPNIFTLAGLGMPVGTPVTDVNIGQRLGYWNGEGLSEELPVGPPGVQGLVRRGRDVWNWMMIVLPLVVFAAAAGWAVYRRRRYSP